MMKNFKRDFSVSLKIFSEFSREDFYFSVLQYVKTIVEAGENSSDDKVDDIKELFEQFEEIRQEKLKSQEANNG